MQKIINFLKQNYYYLTILKVVFGLFVLYYLIFFLTPKVNMSVAQKQQLDSLSILVNQLHEDNVELEKEIDEYNKKIDEVDNHIDKIKGQKTIIKEIYQEEINRVASYTDNDIDSFFANRYK